MNKKSSILIQTMNRWLKPLQRSLDMYMCVRSKGPVAAGHIKTETRTWKHLVFAYYVLLYSKS